MKRNVIIIIIVNLLEVDNDVGDMISTRLQSRYDCDRVIQLRAELEMEKRLLTIEQTKCVPVCTYKTYRYSCNIYDVTYFRAKL